MACFPRVEEAAKIAKNARQEELREGAQPTATDIERDGVDPDEKEAALAQHFEQGDRDAETARQYASLIVARDDWYAFDHRKLYGHQMFGVDSVKGVLVVSLNINHELSDFLDVLEEQESTTSMIPWLDAPLSPCARSCSLGPAYRTIPRRT